jgi:hypothetical protein
MVHSTHWYSHAEGVFREREEMGAVLADGVLSGIPVQCDCTVRGPINTSFVVEPPGANMSFAVPGTYTIRMTPSSPRWVPQTIVVTVDE